MRPKPALRICAATARAPRYGPVTLTFNTCSHCASGISSNGPFSSVAKIDALLINTSTRPHFSMTVSTIATTDDSSATSTLTARPAPPASLISLMTASAFAKSRSATTTMASAAAN